MPSLKFDLMRQAAIQAQMRVEEWRASAADREKFRRLSGSREFSVATFCSGIGEEEHEAVRWRHWYIVPPDARYKGARRAARTTIRPLGVGLIQTSPRPCLSLSSTHPELTRGVPPPLAARWDLCVGVMIVYSAFIIPIRVGFLGDSDAWRVHDLVTDSFFAVDILLTFLTAYEQASPQQPHGEPP